MSLISDVFLLLYLYVKEMRAKCVINYPSSEEMADGFSLNVVMYGSFPCRKLSYRVIILKYYNYSLKYCKMEKEMPLYITLSSNFISLLHRMTCYRQLSNSCHRGSMWGGRYRHRYSYTGETACFDYGSYCLQSDIYLPRLHSPLTENSHFY